MQCIAARCSALYCRAVQCVAVCCRVLHCFALPVSVAALGMCGGCGTRCVAVCRSALQCVAMCFSVLPFLLRLQHLVCVAVAGEGAYRSFFEVHFPQMIHELLGSFVVCAAEDARYAVNMVSVR